MTIEHERHRGTETRCHHALQKAKIDIGERIIASTEYTWQQKEALIAELKEMHQDIRSALVEDGMKGMWSAFERWEDQTLTAEYRRSLEGQVTSFQPYVSLRAGTKTPPR